MSQWDLLSTADLLKELAPTTRRRLERVENELEQREEALDTLRVRDEDRRRTEAAALKKDRCRSIDAAVKAFGLCASSPFSSFFSNLGFVNDTVMGGPSPVPVSSGTIGSGNIERADDRGKTITHLQLEKPRVLAEYTSSPLYTGSRAPQFGVYQSDFFEVLAEDYDASLRALFEASELEHLLDLTIYDALETLDDEKRVKAYQKLAILDNACNRPMAYRDYRSHSEGLTTKKVFIFEQALQTVLALLGIILDHEPHLSLDHQQLDVEGLRPDVLVKRFKNLSLDKTAKDEVMVMLIEFKAEGIEKKDVQPGKIPLDEPPALVDFLSPLKTAQEASGYPGFIFPYAANVPLKYAAREQKTKIKEKDVAMDVDGQAQDEDAKMELEEQEVRNEKEPREDMRKEEQEVREEQPREEDEERKREEDCEEDVHEEQPVKEVGKKDARHVISGNGPQMMLAKAHCSLDLAAGRQSYMALFSSVLHCFLAVWLPLFKRPFRAPEPSETLRDWAHSSLVVFSPLLPTIGTNLFKVLLHPFLDSSFPEDPPSYIRRLSHKLRNSPEHQARLTELAARGVFLHGDPRLLDEALPVPPQQPTPPPPPPSPPSSDESDDSADGQKRPRNATASGSSGSAAAGGATANFGAGQASVTRGARDECTDSLAAEGPADGIAVRSTITEVQTISVRASYEQSNGQSSTGECQDQRVASRPDTLATPAPSTPDTTSRKDPAVPPPVAGKRKRRESPPFTVENTKELFNLRHLMAVHVDWYDFPTHERFVQKPPYLAHVTFGLSTPAPSPDRPPAKRSQLDASAAGPEESPPRLVVHAGVIGHGSSGVALRSTMGGISLVVKICGSSDGLISELRNYKLLEDSLARVGDSEAPLVPIVVGRFVSVDEDRSLLLMEDSGDEMPPFHLWTEPEKHAALHLLKRLHRAGLQHNDIAARNFVQDSCGRLRLLDLQHATAHTCDGSCGEIKVFMQETGLAS